MQPLETGYLTTRELAELLRIKERKVCDLAASGNLPCLRAGNTISAVAAGKDVSVIIKTSGVLVGTED